MLNTMETFPEYDIGATECEGREDTVIHVEALESWVGLNQCKRERKKIVRLTSELKFMYMLPSLQSQTMNVMR
jgi:hypothetical protein